MKKCIICGFNARNLKQEEHGLSFHEIPSGPIREKWIEIINKDDVHPMSRVCSRHFKSEDYRETPVKRRFLHATAVPTLFLEELPPPPPLISKLSVSTTVNNASTLRKNRQRRIPVTTVCTACTTISTCTPPVQTVVRSMGCMPALVSTAAQSVTSVLTTEPPPLCKFLSEPPPLQTGKVLCEIQVKVPGNANALANDHCYVRPDRSNENENQNSVSTQTDWTDITNVQGMLRWVNELKTANKKLEREKAALEHNSKAWTEKCANLKKERQKFLREQFRYRKLNERYESVKSELKKLQKDSYYKMVLKLKEDAVDGNNVSANFLLEQIKLYQSRRAHYSEETLKEASIWFHKGPKAYKHARAKKLLTLPSGSTLKRFLGPTSNMAGVPELLRQKLLSELQKLKECDRHVSLYVDEMEVPDPVSIRGMTELLTDAELRAGAGDNLIACIEKPENTDEETSPLERSSDLDSNENDSEDTPLTNRMCAFVIVGLTKNFQIPCAYNFTKNVSAFDLYSMVKTVMKEVEEIGYTVFRVVADHREITALMFQYLGNGSLPAVQHPVDPTRKLFLSYDNNDITRRLRHQLLNFAMEGLAEQTKEAVIKMQSSIEHIEAMNPAHHFICKHLKQKGVKTINMQRSVQVFSGPVITSLENLKLTSILEYSSTVQLMEILQKWQVIHNILNGQHNSKNPAKIIFLTASDERLKWLQQKVPECLNSIRGGQDTKAKHVLTPEIQEALLLNANSAVQCLEYLIKKFKTFPPLPESDPPASFQDSVEPAEMESDPPNEIQAKNISPKRSALFHHVTKDYHDDPYPKRGLFIIHHGDQSVLHNISTANSTISCTGVTGVEDQNYHDCELTNLVTGNQPGVHNNSTTNSTISRANVTFVEDQNNLGESDLTNILVEPSRSDTSGVDHATTKRSPILYNCLRDKMDVKAPLQPKHVNTKFRDPKKTVRSLILRDSFNAIHEGKQTDTPSNFLPRLKKVVGKEESAIQNASPVLQENPSSASNEVLMNVSPRKHGLVLVSPSKPKMLNNFSQYAKSSLSREQKLGNHKIPLIASKQGVGMVSKQAYIPMERRTAVRTETKLIVLKKKQGRDYAMF